MHPNSPNPPRYSPSLIYLHVVSISRYPYPFFANVYESCVPMVSFYASMHVVTFLSLHHIFVMHPIFLPTYTTQPYPSHAHEYHLSLHTPHDVHPLPSSNPFFFFPSPIPTSVTLFLVTMALAAAAVRRRLL